MSGRPLNQYAVEGRVYWSITPEQNRVLKVTCARSWGQESWRCKRWHTPRPPFLTGRLACIHWTSVRSVLVVVQTHSLSRSSNFCKVACPLHGAARNVCISLGALNDALSIVCGDWAQSCRLLLLLLLLFCFYTLGILIPKAENMLFYYYYYYYYYYY